MDALREESGTRDGRPEGGTRTPSSGAARGSQVRLMLFGQRPTSSRFLTSCRSSRDIVGGCEIRRRLRTQHSIDLDERSRG